MLDAADILVDRHPVIDCLPLEGDRRARRAETQKVPRRVEESVQSVGLALGGSATTRAPDMLPCRMVVERVSWDFEADILGQPHRQVLLRNRDDAAGGAVDDRDRAAPIALPGHSPVA